MKKLITLIIITLIVLPLNVFAANASIKVTSSASTAVVGNNITYTVTLSSGTKIGSWQMTLNYDSSYLKLQSTTAENNSYMANSSSSGTSAKSYTYTFKVLKAGSSTVSVSSYKAYDFTNMGAMNISASGKKVTFKTQAQIEASYSKDNTLSSIGVEGYELKETFNKNTYEYNVVVPEGTKTINLQATKSESHASVSGTGEKELINGNNVFEVIVTAQNGAKQTYKVNVNVIDENPIILALKSEEYTVVKLMEYLTKPESFTESSLIINEIEVPAFKNEILNITLIGLKDKEGNINLYIYNENEEYVLYEELSFSNLTVIPKKTDKIIEGYKKNVITINDVYVDSFKLKSDSRFEIFYGTNVYTGEESFYTYDNVDKTLMIFDNEEVKNLQKDLNEYKQIILYFAGSLTLTFMTLIIVILKKSKKKNKKQSKNNEKDLTQESRMATKEEKVKKSKKKPKKIEEDF